MTADALHTHAETAKLLVERGGEYLLQIKGNQPSILKQARRIMAAASPLLSARKNSMDAKSNGSCF